MDDRLLVPALRAKMGDWVYYISFLKMKDIAARVRSAEHIHAGRSLKEWLQRSLTDNSARIAQYLLSQDQRFFNAIVVGTYGGSPNWLEVSVEGRGRDLPRDLDGVLGFLELSGEEVLFAIDGQHRVEGIRLALKEDESLQEEEVCAIFVKGVSASNRAKDPEGFERTRRLFTTLNRYAKPVSKRDIIALDEDDVVAIVTRRLLEEHSLLREKTALRPYKPIPVENDRDFTTIVALYDVLTIYFKGLAAVRGISESWRIYTKRRPDEADIDWFYEEGTFLFDQLAEHFGPVGRVRDADPGESIAGGYRSREGGHLLFRPIGLEIVVRVVTVLRQQGQDAKSAVEAVARAPMRLEAPPWDGLLWDNVTSRMLTGGENKRVAWWLLLYAVGGNLKMLRISQEKLRNELAGIRKEAPDEVNLPKY